MDAAWLRDLAAAMPADDRAPGPLLRAFLDAVADTLPRTPAAAKAAGTKLFAAVAPQRADAVRDWADELAAGLDSGIRVSLRVEAPDGFDAGRYRAVVQVHSLADPGQIADAAELWETGRFGPRARIDVVLALRRGAQVWLGC